MNFFKGMRILVVAAHPDDELLGCGGTFAKAIDAGAEVAVQFLGEGISARFPVGQYDNMEFRCINIADCGVKKLLVGFLRQSTC